MHSQKTTLWENSRAHEKAEGGFLEISVPQLLMVFWAYKEGHLSLKGLHLWFAGHEIKKTRLNLEDWQSPNYHSREFQRLVGGTDRALREGFDQLRKLGLMTCSDSSIEFATSPDQLNVEDLSTFWPMLNAVNKTRRGTKLKIPRRLVMLIAGGARRGLVATLISQFIWCLFNKRIDGKYQIDPTGCCKASWIVKVFGVCERAVEEQRRHLVRLGVLLPEKQDEWHKHDYGLKLSINLRWDRPDKAVDNRRKEAEVDAVGEGGHPEECRESATPTSEICADSATPYINPHLLSSRELLRNPHPTSGRRIGIKESFKDEKKPRMRKIVDPDLVQMWRLLELFEEAIKRKLFHRTERELLLFISAAEHARVIGDDNPRGLFASMIWNRKDPKWAYVTQSDEDAAIQRIKAHFHPRDERKLAPRPERIVVKAELSEDAKLVQAARQVASKRRLSDPFRVIQQHHPEWTRDRYQAAAEEIENVRFERTMASRGESAGFSPAGDITGGILEGMDW